MVVILVHWLIRKGSEKKFQRWWKRSVVKRNRGLYREILTEIDNEPADPKFHTFSLGDPFYSTFVNIGLWESLAAFDREIGKRIPKAKIRRKKGRDVYSVELEVFEFKMRERVVLKVISDRGDQLPVAELQE